MARGMCVALGLVALLAGGWGFTQRLQVKALSEKHQVLVDQLQSENEKLQAAFAENRRLTMAQAGAQTELEDAQTRIRDLQVDVEKAAAFGRSLNLVKIPAGVFVMGSPSSEVGRNADEVQHRVRISRDFFLGKYEVTQRQWELVMGTNPSRFNGGDRPVELVSSDDAMAFCRNLNEKTVGSRPSGYVFCLPTEAQWEYACRADTRSALNSGKALTTKDVGCPNLDALAWYGGNSGGETHAVGLKPPNQAGLYDMHGNVWEWCSDWYGAYPSGSVTDPRGADAGRYRVFRGGSWRNYARHCRAALRPWYTPGIRYNLGFRLCLSPGRER